MQSACQAIRDYRVLVQVTLPEENAGKQMEEVLYTFKKPKKILMDFRMPRSGTVLVFPDEEGKVLVGPWGWRFLDIHLARCVLLANPSGQQIDQTDLGLLIRNIGMSMDDGRRGAHGPNRRRALSLRGGCRGSPPIVTPCHLLRFWSCDKQSPPFAVAKGIDTNPINKKG